MNTAHLSQHVTPAGSIAPEIYQALDRLARQKSPGAANYRVAYESLPISWGCDDEDFVAIVGHVPFTPAELLAAGFEPAVADAQSIEIAAREARDEQCRAERSASASALAVQREGALQSLIGKTIELSRKIGHDGYRHCFLRIEGTSRFLIVEAAMFDMGGSNFQPRVKLESEDGQSAFTFIRHLIVADKLDAESQCAALLEFAL